MLMSMIPYFLLKDSSIRLLYHGWILRIMVLFGQKYYIVLMTESDQLFGVLQSLRLLGDSVNATSEMFSITI